MTITDVIYNVSLSASYTGGMTSMVIHHLVSTGDDGKVHDWTPIVSAFEEANRLLEGLVKFVDL